MKCQLPAAVRVSKTSLLNVPIAYSDVAPLQILLYIFYFSFAGFSTSLPQMCIVALTETHR